MKAARSNSQATVLTLRVCVTKGCRIGEHQGELDIRLVSVLVQTSGQDGESRQVGDLIRSVVLPVAVKAHSASVS